MTIDLRVECAPDLFVDNQVVNLKRSTLGSDVCASGVAWLSRGVLSSVVLIQILTGVLSKVVRNRKDLELWLLVGTSSWQPDSRLLRFHGLWGGLALRGLNIPKELASKAEALIESDAGLKFFGAARLSELSIEIVSQILLRHNCAYIVALPNSISVRDLFKLGWFGGLHSDFEFIGLLIKSGAILIGRVGQFDDSEQGVVAIGDSGAIDLWR